MNKRNHGNNSTSLQPTNAKQAHEISKLQDQILQEQIVKHQAAEAQIESKDILKAQSQELETMRIIVNDLLKFNHEQSIALKAKEKIEDKRYESTARLSKIATWTSVISMIIAVVATFIQIASTFKLI